MNWLIAIGCSVTILAITIWMSWHSLDELVEMALLDIDMKGDDGVDD